MKKIFFSDLLDNKINLEGYIYDLNNKIDIINKYLDIYDNMSYWKEEIINSFIFEGDKNININYKLLLECLSEKIIDPEKVFNSIFKNEKFIRDTNKRVSISEYVEMRSDYVPIDYSLLSKDIIKKFVNDIICKKNIFISYIGYVLYECIHPSTDGNGRIGRLLFLENTTFGDYYPITTIINKINISNVKNIFKFFNSQIIEIHNKDDILDSLYNCEITTDIIDMIYNLLNKILIGKVIYFYFNRILPKYIDDEKIFSKWYKLGNNIINNPNYTFNLTIKYLKRLFSKYNEKKDEIFNSIDDFISVLYQLNVFKSFD